MSLRNHRGCCVPGSRKLGGMVGQLFLDDLQVLFKARLIQTPVRGLKGLQVIVPISAHQRLKILEPYPFYRSLFLS